MLSSLIHFNGWRVAKAVLSTIAYPAAAALILFCVLWLPHDETPVFDPLRLLRFTGCIAAGPLFLVTASCTGLNDARYNTVGPLIGAAVFAAWLCILFAVPGVRRWSPPIHFLVAFAWLCVGTLLMFKLGEK
jgi:hypothetical protein